MSAPRYFLTLAGLFPCFPADHGPSSARCRCQPAAATAMASPSRAQQRMISSKLSLAIPEGTVDMVSHLSCRSWVVIDRVLLLGNSYFIGQDTSSLHPTLIDRESCQQPPGGSPCHRLQRPDFGNGMCSSFHVGTATGDGPAC